MVKFIGFVHNTGKFTLKDGDQKGREIDYDNYQLNMVNDADVRLCGFQPQLPVKVKTDDLLSLLKCRRDEIEDIFADHLEKEIIVVPSERIGSDGKVTKVISAIYFPE